MDNKINTNTQMAFAKAQQRVEVLAQSYSSQTGKCMSEDELQKLFEKAYKAQLKSLEGTSEKSDLNDYATAISDGTLSFGDLAEMPDSMLEKASKYIKAQETAAEDAKMKTNILLNGKNSTQEEYVNLFKKLLADNMKSILKAEQQSIAKIENEMDIKKYNDKMKKSIDENG